VHEHTLQHILQNTLQHTLQHTRLWDSGAWSAILTRTLHTYIHITLTHSHTDYSLNYTLTYTLHTHAEQYFSPWLFHMCDMTHWAISLALAIFHSCDLTHSREWVRYKEGRLSTFLPCTCAMSSCYCMTWMCAMTMCAMCYVFLPCMEDIVSHIWMCAMSS